MAERRPYTEPFGEFCHILNRFGVDFVVIGSEAVAFHGIPRFSLDFDVFVRPTTVNLFVPEAEVCHLRGALGHLGAFRDPRRIPPVRAAIQGSSARSPTLDDG